MFKGLLAGGWLLGDPAKYDRVRALYAEDALGFVQDTQLETWQKFEALYPRGAEQAFLDRLAEQLDKANPNAATKVLWSFGTLGVLRHALMTQLLSDPKRTKGFQKIVFDLLWQANSDRGANSSI